MGKSFTSMVVMGLGSISIFASMPANNAFVVGPVTFGYVQDYLKLLIGNVSVMTFPEVYDHFVSFCVANLGNKEVLRQFIDFLDSAISVLETFLSKIDSSTKLKEQLKNFKPGKPEGRYVHRDDLLPSIILENIKNCLLGYLNEKPETVRFLTFSDFREKLNTLKYILAEKKITSDIMNNFIFLGRVYFAKKDDITIGEIEPSRKLLSFKYEPVTLKKCSEGHCYKCVLDKKESTFSFVGDCKAKYKMNMLLQKWILKTIENNNSNAADDKELGKNVAVTKERENANKVKSLTLENYIGGMSKVSKDVRLLNKKRFDEKNPGESKQSVILPIINFSSAKGGDASNNFPPMKRVSGGSDLFKGNKRRESMNVESKPGRMLGLRKNSNTYNRNSKESLKSKIELLNILYTLRRANAFSSQKIKEKDLKYESNSFIPCLPLGQHSYS